MRKKTVSITIPVYNEEEELEKHINKLIQYCQNALSSYEVTITIADNASIDRTPEIGKALSQKYPTVAYVRFPEKGRGRAVKATWITSASDFVAYMDVDLSTDLKHLRSVIHALENGYDVAIGSRLLSKSNVIDRSIKREIISRSYNLIIKLLFQTKFSDAQCGFKAIRREAVETLILLVVDNEWFMDSELLILAEKTGYRIYEEPVVWRDNPGSTVRVLPTAMGDLQGLLRLFICRPWRSIRKNKQMV